jgi:hypothetical protein
VSKLVQHVLGQCRIFEPFWIIVSIAMGMVVMVCLHEVNS